MVCRLKRHHLDRSLLPMGQYLPHLASSWLSPPSLSSPDGSISHHTYSPTCHLQPVICVAGISSTFWKGPVNNRPRDSSLLSSTSPVWKPISACRHRAAGGEEVLMCPFHCGLEENVNNHILSQVVIAACIFAKSNTSSEQWWGYSQISPVDIGITFYTALSRCGLYFWWNWI